MSQHYTYQEVFDASVKYFDGDELAAKVFVDKYALQNLNGEYLELTPTDMHRRLAREFARIEAKYPNPMTEDEIFDLLDRFKYVVPQGSPMSGVGNPYQLQSLGNCFVVDAPYDSYGGILKTDQELAQLMKRRCGVGVDLSKIRPKGVNTNNSSKTTDGVGIFMERFSNTTREVAQSGRRGALLESISIEHPEIETFINIKQNLKKVTGANISLRITDKFMQAVKDDKKFLLKWPVESDSPTITKEVNAKDIWDQIINAAWTSAEPGILFWDRIIENSLPDLYANEFPALKTQSTNPCQPAWATVLTPNGIRTINDVNVGDTIWSGKRWAKIINKVCTGVKDVYAFKTRAGTFYGTENHRVLSGGEKIEVQNAESIDVSMFNNEFTVDKTSDDFRKVVVDGLVVGDGMIHKASNNKIVLLIGEKDQNYFNSEISGLIVESCFGIKDTAWSVKTGIKQEELPKTYNRFVPKRYKQGDANTCCAFLRGLYSANGSVVSNRVVLKASSFQIIEDVQQMLSFIGIQSYYTVNKPHEVEFENGTYECKQSYDLNIGTLRGRSLFAKHIGFIHDDKTQKLNKTLETNPITKQTKTTYDIVEKEFINNEPVYDITVDVEEHMYWSGGLQISNCGELPLGLDSCRLMVVNLLSFVENPFTEKAKFDFKTFKDVTVKTQKLMDDLIDLELEHMDKIIEKINNDPEPEEIKSVELKMWEKFKETCYHGRRTGLGITALGDCLAALNIKYGSKESIKITSKIYRSLAIGSHTSSCVMAKERGAFPIFDYNKEKDHEYLKNILEDCDEEVIKLWKKFGRRNIANTTTAPTGSVSTVTQTTSGIEPAYLLSYVRRKKHNPSDKNAKIDFTDAMGDSWQEFTVYHHGLKKWMEATGETDIKKSPYHGATSNEIDWMASVDIQAAAQKSIDHSISKTCNLPETATRELVSQVYMRAWESGCKGFTVYRDKCRDGVLISKSEEKKISEDGRPAEISQSMAPKRPTELPCDIKKVKINGEAWTIFVGMFNGKPYEVFGGLSKYVDIPNKYKSGIISKNGKVDGVTSYNLTIGEDADDQMVIKDIANVFENANFGAFSRTISLALRHGTPVQFVVEQLLKDKHSEITSFSKVIARVLKQYIKDGTKSTFERKCPECGKEDSFAYEEKCLKCLNCGYSKC